MGHNEIPCLITAAENAYVRRTEKRQMAADQVEEAVCDELRADMNKALEGRQEFVPTWTLHNGMAREKLQTAFDAVVEALDYQDVGAQFLKVLAQSECPHVKAFKEVVINAYLAQNVDDIVAARLGE